MRLKKFFERRDLWTVGIYRLQSLRDLVHLGTYRPVHLIGELGVRKDMSYQSVVADPFLYVHDFKLYLFYEVKTDHGHGEIWARRLSESGQWETLGQVLAEPYHLSYPQVFASGGQVYMIPEAAQSGQVKLYIATDFPWEWKECAVLVDSPLLDPTLVPMENGKGYMLLATTRNSELKSFYAHDVRGPFVDMNINITNSKFNARCAGSPLRIDGQLYRLAQDCSRIYGERIIAHRVLEISPYRYVEGPAIANFVGNTPEWMAVGHHHLSSVAFNGDLYVAVDGRRKDRYINTLMLGLVNIFGRLLSTGGKRCSRP